MIIPGVTPNGTALDCKSSSIWICRFKSYHSHSLVFVEIAQLVERLFEAQKVIGSKPILRTLKNYKGLHIE